MMISDLSPVKEIQLVEREKMQDLLKEIDLQHTKYFDSTTSVKVGKMVGAEYVVVGAFAAVEPKMRIDTRIIRVATGEVVKTAQVTGDQNKFFDLEKALSDRLIDGLGIVMDPEEAKRVADKQQADRIDALQHDDQLLAGARAVRPAGLLGRDGQDGPCASSVAELDAPSRRVRRDEASCDGECSRQSEGQAEIGDRRFDQETAPVSPTDYRVKILVIDIGGTHVKALASGQRVPIKIDSGRTMTPRAMIRGLKEPTAGWEYDRVSIGYPGPVRDGKPAADPYNLGSGWVGFDFAKAFGKPVRIVNDAAMQAIGSYDGGNMLFLGLGTGLGTTMIRDGVLIPLEMAHLPYRKEKTYEQYLGDAAYKSMKARVWRKHVLHVIDLFVAALVVDYVVLGGGNSRHMKELPSNVRMGANANAFKGGFRLWEDDKK